MKKKTFSQRAAEALQATADVELVLMREKLDAPAPQVRKLDAALKALELADLCIIKDKNSADIHAPAVPEPPARRQPPFDPATERPGYVLVPLTQVPSATWRAAKAALATAQAELGLRSIRTEWYVDWYDELGFTHPNRPNCIHVRADLSPELATEIVRHELMHLKQFKRGVSDHEEMEAEANAFANR